MIYGINLMMGLSHFQIPSIRYSILAIRLTLIAHRTSLIGHPPIRYSVLVHRFEYAWSPATKSESLYTRKY